MEVVEKPWLKHASGQPFYGFKDVTLVPYEPKLMDLSLLSVYHVSSSFSSIDEQKDNHCDYFQRRWLNQYNSRIRQLVGAELKKQNRSEAFFWMMEKTKYIPENGSNSILKNPSLRLFVVNIALLQTVRFLLCCQQFCQKS